MPGIGQAPPTEWPSGGTSGQTLTKTGSADTAVGWVSSVATAGFPGLYVSGRWYPCNSRYNGSYSAFVGLVANYMVFVPFLTVGVTVAGLGGNFAGQFGNVTVTMSIWTANSSNEPGTVLATAPSASAGTYSGVLSSPVSLDAGLYWIAAYSGSDASYYGISPSGSAGAPNTYVPSHWNGSVTAPSPANIPQTFLQATTSGSSPGNNPAVAFPSGIFGTVVVPVFWVKAG
jgi:hypothetical protein